MEKSMKLEVENEKELVKVDDLGRVTLRLKLREKHGIKERDRFEIYEENNSIMLRKLDVLTEKEELTTGTYKINGDIEINIQINKVKETILNINDIGHYVRRIDEFGRIVLPIELRMNRDIYPNNELEVNEMGNNIALTKKERCKKHGKRHSSYNNKRQRQHCQRY